MGPGGGGVGQRNGNEKLDLRDGDREVRGGGIKCGDKGGMAGRSWRGEGEELKWEDE